MTAETGEQMWHRLADERAAEIARLRSSLQVFEEQVTILRDALKESEDYMRRACIRSAAVVIMADSLVYVRSDVADSQRAATESWRLARQLWDAKPEDC